MQSSKSSFAIKSSATSSPKIVLVNITWNIIMPPNRLSRGVMRYGIAAVFLASLSMVVFYTLLFTFHGGPDSGTPKPLLQRYVLGDAGPIVQRRFRSKMEFTFPESGELDNKVVAATPVWDIEIMQVSNTSVLCGPVKLLILITSALDNSEKRKAIRNTWCHSNMTTGDEAHYHVQCVFLLGQSEDVSMNEDIRGENSIHHDMLIGNYIDTYRNLSLKVFTGFQWAHSHCSAKFILKTDDDCFINTRLLSSFLSQHNKIMEDLYIGNVFRTDKDTLVIRERESKWYVPFEQFAPAHYPNYASGTGYLMSADVITKLLHYTRYYRPFPNEDAYVGVLLERAGVVPSHSYRFTLFSNKWTVCNFMFLFVIHNVEPRELYNFQKKAEQAPSKCTQHDVITEWT